MNGSVVACPEVFREEFKMQEKLFNEWGIARSSKSVKGRKAIDFESV